MNTTKKSIYSAVITDKFCMFAVEIRQISLMRSISLQEYLYNVNKGIVSLSSVLLRLMILANLGELCPLFCRSIFF